MNSLATLNLPATQMSVILGPKSKKTGIRKEVGTRILFGSTESASAIKKRLRDANPKMTNSQRTVLVNEVLTGKTTLAWAEHGLLVEAARSMGLQPDSADVKAKSAVFRFVAPEAVKAAKPVINVESVAKLSKEEKDALLALLMA